MPLPALRGMSRADLALYQRYAAQRHLPGQRIELLLAQVSLVLAQVNGNKNLTLADFLPSRQASEEQSGQDSPDPEQAAQAVAQALGYSPRRKQPTATEESHGKQTR